MLSTNLFWRPFLETDQWPKWGIKANQSGEEQEAGEALETYLTGESTGEKE
jgi:hypothetical protein